MSENMLERVASAIVAAGDPDAQEFDEWRIAAARAAVEAMREPTLEMRKACSFETAEIEYPAMIDAALSEPKTE